MELVFHEYDGTTAALNPRIEHRGSQFTLKLNEQNCDYFLVMAQVPGGQVNLHDPVIQKALMEKQENFLNAQDEALTDEITFSCVEWSDYRVNDYAIDISSRIAEYTVVGCREENGKLLVFMPGKGVTCTACVSLTVFYRIKQVSGDAFHRPLSKNVPQQMFYVVELDDILNYQDGSIVYTFEGFPWKYPVTKEMLGKGIYIEAGYGMPVFSAVVSGLELQQA